MQKLKEAQLLKLDMPSHNAAKEEMKTAVCEIVAVGATGTKFEKTQDLEAMTCAEAMQDPRREKVMEAFDTEHEKFLKHCVWKAIDERDALPTDKMLDTTTVSEFKPNGDCRGRVVARGFEQKEGTQHNEDDLAAPAIDSTVI